jgi:exosortase/archaeosortase family protein
VRVDPAGRAHAFRTDPPARGRLRLPRRSGDPKDGRAGSARPGYDTAGLQLAAPAPMVRFVLIFLVLLGVLFTTELLQPVQQHVIVPFTSGLAHVCVWLMRLFDRSVVAQGDAVLAFPAPWKHRLAGIGLGFVAIQALNLVRIISLYYLQRWNMAWFEWFHLYLWQALIILDALVFWLVWLRWLPREPERAPPAAMA